MTEMGSRMQNMRIGRFQRLTLLRALRIIRFSERMWGTSRVLMGIYCYKYKGDVEVFVIEGKSLSSNKHTSSTNITL